VAEKGFWDGWSGTVAVILAAVLVFASILAAMAVYAGTWPPLSVVESSSMQHDDDRSMLGVIDTGDLVIVQVSDGEDVVTYVEGYQTGYSMFGDYGDVIIYRPQGDEDRKPIIHRAVMFLEPVGSDRWSAPALAEYPDHLWSVDVGDHAGMRGTLELHGYGHASVLLEIDLDKMERVAGFITHGDNNHKDGIGYVDQMVLDEGKLVQKDWVMSRAAVEIPWIGSLSLLVRNVNVEQVPLNSIVATFVVIATVIVAPLSIEYGLQRLRRGSD